jgi:protein-S-isoprenylcysteine O-methyltransferase Ste14
MAYLVLLMLWVVWCVLHSLLVAPRIATNLQQRLGTAKRFYRLGYNIFALLSLAPILVYTFHLQPKPIVSWQGQWRLLQMLLLVTAGGLFAAGARHYDLRQFLGIRQLLKENQCAVLTSDCRLHTSGILNAMRHPWYAAAILLIWARDVTVVVLITNLVLTAYLLIGARLEEGKLQRQFGVSYRLYKQRVSMIFPYKWVHSFCKRSGEYG